MFKRRSRKNEGVPFVMMNARNVIKPVIKKYV
jgi:hypothetical protein